MARYWLTFRIREDQTAHQRRDAVNDVIAKHASGPVWAEPTSFMAFESASAPGSIARDLRSEIDQLHDIVVLHPLSNGPAYVLGHALYPNDLKAVLPNTLYFNT